MTETANVDTIMLGAALKSKCKKQMQQYRCLAQAVVHRHILYVASLWLILFPHLYHLAVRLNRANRCQHRYQAIPSNRRYTVKAPNSKTNIRYELQLIKWDVTYSL